MNYNLSETKVRTFSCNNCVYQPFYRIIMYYNNINYAHDMFCINIFYFSEKLSRLCLSETNYAKLNYLNGLLYGCWR